MTLFLSKKVWLSEEKMLYYSIRKIKVMEDKREKNVIDLIAYLRGSLICAENLLTNEEYENDLGSLVLSIQDGLNEYSI